MNKRFLGNLLTITFVTVIALGIFSGCTDAGKKNHPKNQTTSGEKEVYKEKEGWWTENMEQFKEFELKLQVEPEKKNAFLKKYGEDIYYSALSSCVNFLFINQNSAVADGEIEALKKQYDVKAVNLKSSFDGHAIPADYITTGDEDADTIIFVHGQGCNRRTNLGIASRFLERGYHILTFDLRNSGENQAPFTTFGAWEKYDLQDYVNYVAKRVKKPHKIIIWGGSYGGSVIAAGLGMEEINEKVDYAILDGPVASMESMLRIRMKEYIKDEEMDDVLKACDLFLQDIIGFSMEDADGTRAIQKTKVPVLIFASKADTTVPLKVSKSLYDAMESEKKKIHVFENVGHCMGSTSKPEIYFGVVKQFFEKY